MYSEAKNRSTDNATVGKAVPAPHGALVENNSDYKSDDKLIMVKGPGCDYDKRNTPMATVRRL